MGGRRSRRLSILDVLVLIGATAAGLGWMRSSMGAIRAVHGTPDYPRDAWRTGLCGLLIVWAAALLALRVRPPWRHLRRTARRPGTAVCVAVVLVAAIELALGLELDWLGHPEDPFFAGVLRSLDPRAFALAIVGAWLVAAMGPRRRPAPDAIDRLGRAVGAAWLVVTTYFAWYPGD